MQNDVVRSEQQVRIAERQAMAVAEAAKGEATAFKLRRGGRGDVGAGARRSGSDGHAGAR